MAGLGSPAEVLIGLAQSRSSEGRERVAEALALLCDTPSAASSPRAAALINDVFMVLVAQAEHDVRVRLAERVAPARWAPSALVNALAMQDIEIARPVIAKSPVLTDADLVRLLVVSTVEHQIEVARRPAIGAAVVAAVLGQQEPSVLTALAGNETAAVTDLDLERLVGFARPIASLRAPLARHPRLSSELAFALYAVVGEVLRRDLAARFSAAAEGLGPEIEAAVRHSADGRAASVHADPEREEMESRLIAKLQAAGELRPGFLLRALREGKLYLFQVALAALAHMRTDEVRDACDSDRPELVALACAAVGIDRGVFPTLLSLLRGLNQGRPAGAEPSPQNINRAFSLKSPDDARAAFRQEIAAAPLGAPLRDRA